jgi:hypothetical protein
LTETSARLVKPVLRPPEKHQLGYNNILLPQDQAVSDEVVAAAAALLKLSTENVREAVSHNVALPVARTASREECELVTQRLRELGLKCLNVSDAELGLSFSSDSVRRVRSMVFDDISWSDIILILTGRLFESRLEITERMTRKTENEILHTSEFSRDEFVIDFYTAGNSQTSRVSGNGFDFSCLGHDKALIANENMGRLLKLMMEKAVNAKVDDSYARVRNLLELVWTTEAETQSSGWRRQGPGKLSVGASTIKSNETQFTRYSRLSYYLKSRG